MEQPVGQDNTAKDGSIKMASQDLRVVRVVFFS